MSEKKQRARIRSQERKFKRSLQEYFVFAAVAAAMIVGAALPSAVFASSPVTDTLDSGLSGWSGVFGRVLPDSTNGVPPCYSGNCAGQTVSGAYNVGIQKTGTALNVGAVVFYFRHVAGSGGIPSDSLLFPTICNGNCDSGPNQVYNAISNTYDDGNWHYVYFAWKDGGGGTKIFCMQVDDANDADCSYGSFGYSIANGTTFDTVAVWAQNHLQSGEKVYIDEFSGGTTVAQLPTQIYTVTPANNATTSTSSALTVGVTGFISPTVANPAAVQITLNISSFGCQVNGVAVVLVVSYKCEAAQFQWFATTTGAFSFSTTTPILQVGGHYVVAQLQNPSFTFFGYDIGSNTLDSTTTEFYAATSTLLDSLVASSKQFVGSLASTTASIANVCNPANFTDFNFQTCIAGLFIPDPSAYGAALGVAQKDVASVPAAGFVMTVYGALGSNSSTTSLPSWSIALPISTPGAGYSVDLTPWSLLFAPGTMLASTTNPNTGHNLKDIVQPGWTFFVYVLGTFVIIQEIFGIGGKVISI